MIYLFQSGAPSQLDLFDYKPQLRRPARHGAARLDPHGPAAHRHDRAAGELPGRAADVRVRPARPERRLGQRAAAAHGAASPTTSASSSRCTPRRSTTTRRSRSSRPARSSPGRPSIGAWLAYGLGSENHDLPAFVVLISQGTRQPDRSAALRPPLGQRLPADAVSGRQVPLAAATRCCTCPTRRASTRDRGGGCSTTWRKLNQLQARRGRRSRDRHAHRPVRDGLSACRPSVPELTDLSRRAASTSSSCTAPTSRKPGHVRRQLPAGPPAGRARRAVRPALPPRLGPARQPARRRSRGQCRDTDQPSAALIQDLKQRGLLDDTLVVWGGEFGRTVYCQGKLTADDYGRDHHPRCFTIWLAGGGIKPGITLRRDRRLLLQHRPATRSTSTTCTPRSCTASASTTRG